MQRCACVKAYWSARLVRAVTLWSGGVCPCCVGRRCWEKGWCYTVCNMDGSVWCTEGCLLVLHSVRLISLGVEALDGPQGNVASRHAGGVSVFSRTWLCLGGNPKPRGCSRLSLAAHIGRGGWRAVEGLVRAAGLSFKDSRLESSCLPYPAGGE